MIGILGKIKRMGAHCTRFLSKYVGAGNIETYIYQLLGNRIAITPPV